MKQVEVKKSGSTRLCVSMHRTTLNHSCLHDWMPPFANEHLSYEIISTVNTFRSASISEDQVHSTRVTWNRSSIESPNVLKFAKSSSRSPLNIFLTGSSILVKGMPLATAGTMPQMKIWKGRGMPTAHKSECQAQHTRGLISFRWNKTCIKTTKGFMPCQKLPTIELCCKQQDLWDKG